jgi:hypothetical protein
VYSGFWRIASRFQRAFTGDVRKSFLWIKGVAATMGGPVLGCLRSSPAEFSRGLVWLAVILFINLLPEWKLLNLGSLGAVGVSGKEGDQRVEVFIVNALFAS